VVIGYSAVIRFIVFVPFFRDILVGYLEITRKKDLSFKVPKSQNESNFSNCSCTYVKDKGVGLSKDIGMG